MIKIHYQKTDKVQIYLVARILERTERHIKAILVSGQFRLFEINKVLVEEVI